MASIVETISGDRRLQLGNEEFTRQMGWSSDWKRIRIGVRVAFNGNATITTPNFQIGVCTGTANGYKSNTADYMAWRFNSSGSWSFTSGPPAYYSGTFNFATVYRVGSTDTTNLSSSATGFVTAAPASVRSAMYVTIFKPVKTPTVTTVFSIQGFYPGTSGAAQTDVVLQEFYRMLEAEVMGTEYCALGSQVNQTYAGAGLFDSVSIYWNNASPTVEICDLAVCRFE